MTTTNVINKFVDLPLKLKRRGIIQRNGYPFQVRWLDRMIRDFEAVPKPVSITYSAKLNIEGIWYNGEIEVDREGNLFVRMDHE